MVSTRASPKSREKKGAKYAAAELAIKRSKAAKAKAKAKAPSNPQPSGSGKGKATPSKTAAAEEATSDKDSAIEKVRVWWEPTRDRKRTDFAGAYWPATVVKKKGGRYTVRYDNGDIDDDVDQDHVSPFPPVDFGQEKHPLQIGEFCEVSNNSRTDPCAWLGKVTKIDKNGDLVVAYPFHDTSPEAFKVERVRRARVLEKGKWLLIKPHQRWKNGEVASPLELELIDEKELDEYVDLPGQSKDHKAHVNKGDKGKKKGRTSEHGAQGSGQQAQEAEGESSKKRKKDTEEAHSSKAGRKRKAAESSSAAAMQAGAMPGMEGHVAYYVPQASGHRLLTILPVDSPVPVGAIPVPTTLPVAPLGMMGASPAPTLSLQLPGSGAAGTPAAPISTPGAAAPLGPVSATATDTAALAAGHLTSAEDDDGKKRKHKKDPNAPKRPKSAYNLFTDHHRARLVAEHGGKSEPGMLKVLGDLWKNASAEDKAPFEEEAAKVRKQYEEEMKHYMPPSAQEFSDEEPTKPKTPYNFFKQDFRKTLSEQSKLGKSAEASSAAAGLDLAAPAPAAAGEGHAGEAAGDQKLADKAAQAWKSVDEATKKKYEELASKDKERYERELVEFNRRKLTAMATKTAGSDVLRSAQAQVAMLQAAAMAAAAAAATSSGSGPGAPPPFSMPFLPMLPSPPPAALSMALPFPAEVVDNILNNGIDLKKMRRKLSDHGFTPEAYMLLVDVWRKESPRLGDALRSFRSHVEGNQRPDWTAFLVAIFGLEKVKSMKKPDTKAQQEAAAAATGAGAGAAPTAAAAAAAAAAPANGAAAANGAAGAADEAKVKRGPGRPRKSEAAATPATTPGADGVPAKRPRGRPRKTPLPDPPQAANAAAAAAAARQPVLLPAEQAAAVPLPVP